MDPIPRGHGLKDGVIIERLPRLHAWSQYSVELGWQFVCRALVCLSCGLFSGGLQVADEDFLD